MKRLTLSLLAAMMIFSAATAQSTFVSQRPVKDRKGATVKGIVEADGKPLAGVVVSDGYEVTTTDKAGRYYLNSEKRNGNVFITIPSGYEAQAEDAVPQYWANLTAPAEEVERHDFNLKATDNRRHAIIAVTDIHLANQYDDIRQFRQVCLPRIREEVEKYRSQGIPVYTVCMGDSSFDLFWYDYLFDIGDFRRTLDENGYPTQVFHSMGNHDNDGATPNDENTDFNATRAYRKVFGPTYYSFNIGDVHYVMLDNIVYKNEAGGKKGKNIAGRRNYDHYVSDEQLDWLRKDLSYVTDKNTPIVIGMHCPVFRYKGLSEAIVTRFVSPEKAQKLTDVLKEFSNVHFLTGHTHKNLFCKGTGEISNITDHNIAAVCGAWWFTGSHGGLHLGPDGGPAGFEVFTLDGKQMEWYFVSADDGAGKQFRTFDINSVRDYYRSCDETKVFVSHYPKRTDFSEASDNQVYIHVWAWEPTWKISVKENGKEIPVVRKMLENPQYTISYYIPKSLWRRSFPKSYGKDTSPHMFLVQASAPDTTLEITVTDSFGNEYHETMVRPKEFSKTMR